jgi:hypothetical protein
VDGTIVNADINASAAIADTKLATISTAGKVSNSATTATNANTANAIVARDASGNFSAGTITANLTGTASAIADGSVSTAKIADDAVTNDKLSLAANAGEIKKALNADNAPPIYACRAWVNFDGTKDTTGAASTANTNRQIRASANVTSVLRNAAGDYTVTFSTGMTDANYSIQLNGDLRTSYGTRIGTPPVASGFRFRADAIPAEATYSAPAAVDREYNFVAVFR